MNICINLVGQPKKCDLLKEQMKYLVTDNPQYRYHFLYTTWTSENPESIRKQIPNIHVKQVALPNDSDELFKMYSNKYTLDNSNLGMGKKRNNYIYALYIRKHSKQHILEYEKNHNITFDIVITTRPDLKINEGSNSLHQYFEHVISNRIFTSRDLTFDVFGQGAVTDVIYMSSRNTMLLFLDSLPFIQSCVVTCTNIIHPETFNYKWIHLFFESVIMDMYAYICI